MRPTHGMENAGTSPATTAGTCTARTAAVTAVTRPAVTDGGTRSRCSNAGNGDNANGNNTVAGSSNEIPASNEVKSRRYTTPATAVDMGRPSPRAGGRDGPVSSRPAGL